MLSLYLRPISFPLDVHVTPQQIIHPSYQFIKYESLTKDPYLDPLNNWSIFKIHTLLNKLLI